MGKKVRQFSFSWLLCNISLEPLLPIVVLLKTSLKRSLSPAGGRVGRVTDDRFRGFGSDQGSTETTTFKYFLGTIRGRTVARGDTSDVSPALSMTFPLAIAPYTLEIHQWRAVHNNPCSSSEIL